jgi:hypothetical protein
MPTWMPKGMRETGIGDKNKGLLIGDYLAVIDD